MEFSRNLDRGGSREEIAFYRQPDHGRTQTSRSRHSGSRTVPDPRHQLRPFYKWRSRYGGMDVPMMPRIKELEDENRRLKKMYAESQMSADILKEALTKNGEAISAP